MTLQSAIGNTLRELRHERNMTLRALSTKSFIALGYLSELETGRKAASPEVLESIALGLDLTTTELVKEIYEYLEQHA